MLVLDRWVGESVMILDDITVTVLRVRNSQVRLGFVADPRVLIYRKEVHERIQRERRLASVATNPNTRTVITTGQHLICARRVGARTLFVPTTSIDNAIDSSMDE